MSQENADQQAELTPQERKRQLVEGQLQRARRRLEELRREDYDSDRAYRAAQMPRQRVVWQLEEELTRLDSGESASPR
jgi:hypothetical protein